ncbi:MBL fold metallo-hydrolase [Swingsia samuiensis]|uniref:MBL fold metallo-hydrolase n=1 Tax=Swingsia samuiensis TaxID=1293412 RepID=A0A4Y6UJG5_9PROT|nr:MBL fold metallo-hydrolase [Swingsia samuiensis]QDH16145.1 MBL fold metallo-hydrolase [Swingsia samuiensis]
MKVTILGCGGSAGVPMIGGGEGADTGIWGRCDPEEPKNRRTRSSIVVETDSGFRLLIDSGPDFRSQMLACGLNRVNAVLYTHPHSDHIGGLDELRAINRMINAPLPLLATQEVLDELKARFSYAFAPWHGSEFYRPVFEEHILKEDQEVMLPELRFKVFSQRHGRITSLGAHFGAIAYCTDVETLSEQALDMLHGVDTWVVDCFQYQPHPAHAWLERVLEWREKIQPKHTILTHMGTEMDYMTLRAELPDNVEPAYDGMVLQV